MGDPDASVIPAARDFREGHHAVARLSEHLWRGRDVAFEPKSVLSTERGTVGETMQLGAEIGGRDTMASFRFLSQIGVLYARTALVGCGAL
jgi:hypothetical protein